MRLETALQVLIAGTLALWVLLFLPARYLWGREAALCGLVAAILCIVPTSFMLVWGRRKETRLANQQVQLALIGTGVRMGFVLAVGLGLSLAVAYFQHQS